MDDIASNVGDVVAATEIDFSPLSGANATFIAVRNRLPSADQLMMGCHATPYSSQL